MNRMNHQNRRNHLNLSIALDQPRRGGPRGRGHHGDVAGGPGFGPGFGPGAGFGPGPDFGRGFGGHGPRGGERGPRRGRRGDVRRAILALLAEEPMNGYGIITAIAERADASWQPGPGSVYPALRALDEEGLIAPDASDDDPRRKVFALTEDGRAYADAHADELAQAFQAATTPRRGFREMRRELGQLAVAVEQVVVAGHPDQLEAAQQVLADARRSLYRILSEEPTGASEDARTGGAPTGASEDASSE